MHYPIYSWGIWDTQREIWLPPLTKLVSGGVGMSSHTKWLWAHLQRTQHIVRQGLLAFWGWAWRDRGNAGSAGKGKLGWGPMSGTLGAREMQSLDTRGGGGGERKVICWVLLILTADMSLSRSLSYPSDLVWLLPPSTAAQAPCSISTCILGLPDQLSTLRKLVFS